MGIHSRWAMLGAAGCVTPEILGSLGIIPAETAVPWFKSGVIPPAGSFQNYRNPGSQGNQYFLGLEKALCGSGDPAYPGGPIFNILGMGSDENAMNDLKLKEIKNGRLAMLAMFGYGAQAVLT